MEREIKRLGGKKKEEDETEKGDEKRKERVMGREMASIMGEEQRGVGVGGWF